MGELERAHLARARRRLATIGMHVRMRHVRIVHAPWLFRIPGFRRYRGYALWRTILVRDDGISDDLLTHELCHLWQGQHRRWHMVLVYLLTRYEVNPYEVEARAAVAATRADPEGVDPAT